MLLPTSVSNTRDGVLQLLCSSEWYYHKWLQMTVFCAPGEKKFFPMDCLQCYLSPLLNTKDGIPQSWYGNPHYWLILWAHGKPMKRPVTRTFDTRKHYAGSEPGLTRPRVPLVILFRSPEWFFHNILLFTAYFTCVALSHVKLPCYNFRSSGSRL
jgi:hypothetical protein